MWFEDNLENRGRTLAELRQDPVLTQWPAVEHALSEKATADWEEAWDAGGFAQGPKWQSHCADPERLAQFKLWLSRRSERRVAVVSHFGTINNLMNREPWTEGKERHPQPASFWPEGGIVRRFNIPNAGWVGAVMC